MYMYLKFCETQIILFTDSQQELHSADYLNNRNKFHFHDKFLLSIQD